MPDHLASLLREIEAAGRVEWDGAAGVYRSHLPDDADPSARAHGETIARLMTYLRQESSG